MTSPWNVSPGKASAVNVAACPGLDLAYVGLVHRDPDLHARQVLGEQEQAGRAEARHDRLPDVDAAVDDDAFDRRLDGAVSEVPLGPVEAGRSLAHRGLGLADGGLGDGHVGLGHLEGRLVGVVLGLRPGPRRGRVSGPGPSRSRPASSLAFIWSRLASASTWAALAWASAAVGRRHVGGVQRIVNLRQHHPFVNDRAVVDGLAGGVLAEGIDHARHLGPDVDDLLGLHRAGGADGGQEIAPLNGRHAEGDGRLPRQVLVQEDPARGEARQDDQDDDNFQKAFHGSFRYSGGRPAAGRAAVRPCSGRPEPVEAAATGPSCPSTIDSKCEPSFSRRWCNRACCAALSPPRTTRTLAAWPSRTVSTSCRPAGVRLRYLARRSLSEAVRATRPWRSSRSMTPVILGGRTSRRSPRSVRRRSLGLRRLPGAASAARPTATG